jgi:hypothetical protein
MNNKNMHEILMLATQNLPMRVIELDGDPYLRRYFLREDDDGTQVWLHHFLRNDYDRALHTHPWSAVSEILCGGYTEETPKGLRSYAPGETNTITPDTLHKIVSVEPNTWTLMTVSGLGDIPAWEFIDSKTGERREKVKSSGPDWWKKYGPRAA